MLLTSPRLTGPDLRERRKDAELTQAQVAARLGVVRQRVAFLEALAAPPRRAVRQYLTALAEIDAER